MLHWAELNCTACEKCSFCADNRPAEGASGFCIYYCCYFRSIKLNQVNMSTLEFLVLLHCSCSPDDTASEKQLPLHSWHVCTKQNKTKKSRVRQMFCKRARPESLTRAHLLHFHLDPHLKSRWSVWKWLPAFLPFSVCVSEQLMSNVLRLNFTPVVGSGAGNGMREQHRYWQWQGQGPDTKDSTCLFPQQMNIVHPSEPPAQTGYQSAAGCVSGWEMTRTLIFRHRGSCLHGGYTEGKLLTDVVWSLLKIPKAKVYYALTQV